MVEQTGLEKSTPFRDTLTNHHGSLIEGDEETL